MSFQIDVYNGNTLLLIPDFYDASDHEKFKGFPERRWHNSNGITGWSVPVTQPNIAWLESNWVKGQDYKVRPSARILLAEQILTVKVDELKTAKRWEYLFENKPPTFDYPCVLKPFDHQRVTVEAAYGAAYFGLLMEMGTGKTKCFIDETMLYGLGLKENELLKIVVTCPKGLIGNWEREFKKNYPDHFLNYHIACLNKGELKAIGQITDLLCSTANIKIVIVSQDSVATLLPYLLLLKPTILGIDESHYLKNPSTQRWKSIKLLAEASSMRRILTGTPIANNIMDVWSQFELLRPGVLGYSTFNAFKQRFAEYNDWNGHSTVTGYKDENIAELQEAMAKCSFVVKKSECLDLPPKRYDTMKFEMPPAMRDIYEKFSTEFFVQLENGSTVETEFIIVQMLKLSQICSGYVSAIKKVEMGDAFNENEEPEITRSIEYIPGGDTKLEGLLERADDVLREGKLIIWSRFKLDSEAIHRALTEKYKDRGWFGGKYDSTVNDATREYNKCAFGDMAKDGPTAGNDNFRWLCGSPRAGGVGLTLLGTLNVRCTNVFYYNNDFNFGARDQSEDRVHRIGLKNPVLYTDFVYEDSIEEYIAQKLQNKRDLATAVKNVGEIRELLLKGSKVNA